MQGWVNSNTDLTKKKIRKQKVLLHFIKLSNPTVKPQEKSRRWNWRSHWDSALMTFLTFHNSNMIVKYNLKNSFNTLIPLIFDWREWTKWNHRVIEERENHRRSLSQPPAHSRTSFKFLRLSWVSENLCICCYYEELPLSEDKGSISFSCSCEESYTNYNPAQQGPPFLLWLSPNSC